MEVFGDAPERREAYRRLDLKAEGMEFASEMLIKAAVMGMRIGEVPIRYYPREEGSSSKLRTFRDGWRHLRAIMISYIKSKTIRRDDRCGGRNLQGYSWC